ncbi:MAG: A/G-specific adenine glycosylase [Nocardioides sp.]|nr:A/G-specific adenine glycosylase [Nocardioides sp.]
MSDLHQPVLEWYDEHARDLPWRRTTASVWSVMVSEFMLQQTPVVRVLPVHAAWLERWPTPADLAAEEPGAALRAWGRLGYPRRALRLHTAAVAIVERHGGAVPDSHDDLLALPGVGDYTAAAIASFGFGQRHVVLDTNVRRVFARAVTGAEFPANSLTRAERDLAATLLPEDEATAATWAVAVMELGALVCVANAPKCGQCPLSDRCAWVASGRPAYDGPPRRGQTYAGTDRQVRGRLLGMVRDHEGPVTKARLDLVWDDQVQRDRALSSLVSDGLLVPEGERYRLP